MAPTSMYNATAGAGLYQGVWRLLLDAPAFNI